MSFYVIRKEDKYFIEFSGQNAIFGGAGEAMRFESSTRAEQCMSNFPPSYNEAKLEFIKTPETISDLPPEIPNMNFDFYYSQASKHLRQADMKGPPGTAIAEHGLNSAIMHAEFAVAFLKMAKSNLQGELF